MKKNIPNWIRSSAPSDQLYFDVKNMLKDKSLVTVCKEAKCPNISECWSQGTATFMILGDLCTRSCRFCAIKSSKKGRELNFDQEFSSISSSIERMKLKYVVLTSVDRDDLDDGGAGYFSDLIRAIKLKFPFIKIECLTPDFAAKKVSIELLSSSGADVLSHNIETVSRLSPLIRDRRADYNSSLNVLKRYSLSGNAIIKSSIMLGLGETLSEIEETFKDLRRNNVNILTIGQYLRPSKKHAPVKKYYSISEFEELKLIALKIGFELVIAGPLVRSSYKAADFYNEYINGDFNEKNDVT